MVGVCIIFKPNCITTKPDRKGPLGIPRRTWEDNIVMYLLKNQLEVLGLDSSGLG